MDASSDFQAINLSEFQNSKMEENSPKDYYLPKIRPLQGVQSKFYKEVKSIKFDAAKEKQAL